jgi:Protein of unknown function (DUF2806)
MQIGERGFVTSMNEGHSVVKFDFGGLSEPATALIKAIEKATGGIFRPSQIRRVAKAEAEADIIKATAQIEIVDLERRALHRFLHEEAKKQSNIESITQKALPAINNDARPQEIEDDWIINFFDKCRLISDEQMQNLWAKVLAGQANSPGHFSKQTVNLLASLEKADAELFRTLCSFVWYLGEEPILMIFDFNATDDVKIYAKAGIDSRTLQHLETIGLVGFAANLFSFERRNHPSQIVLTYYGSRANIKFLNPENNTLEHGKVALTKAGRELAFISGSMPCSGFKDSVFRWWRYRGYVVTEI